MSSTAYGPGRRQRAPGCRPTTSWPIATPTGDDPLNLAVLDASALVAALVDTGPDGRWAEEQLATHELCGPHLLPCEASNILRRRWLAGQLGDDEASSAHADLLALDIALLAFEPIAGRAWGLRGNVTAYDAWYVAIAEAFECPLVTLDVRLARAPGVDCEVRVPPAAEDG